MKNYFDQKFKTKFSKQTITKVKDFQWVIEEMEREFEYPEKDIQNIDEFFLNWQNIIYISVILLEYMK